MSNVLDFITNLTFKKKLETDNVSDNMDNMDFGVSLPEISKNISVMSYDSSGNALFSGNYGMGGALSWGNINLGNYTSWSAGAINTSGTSGQILQSNGSVANPSWATSLSSINNFIGNTLVGNSSIWSNWNGPLGPIVELDDSPKTNGTTPVPTDYFGILHPTPTELNVDFYYTTQYMYSATIMKLDETEMYLNKGRFKKYVNQLEDGLETNFWTRKSNITEIVEWICENISGKWTISAITTNHMTFDFVFKLENKIDAGHFALRWK